MEYYKPVFFVVLVLSFFAFLFPAPYVDTESAVSKQEPKYKHELYTLENGSRCLILYGGTHSGVLGISCEAAAHR